MTNGLHNPVIEQLDLQAHAGSWPSPCISVCVMNPQTGWCDGCLRTIDEIVQWSGATDSDKQAIWIEIKRRYASAGGNQGGPAS
jgi:predicted Fe-S protein YdhL (DUF1289 family)